MTTGSDIEVADTDQEMSLVDRLRLGGPNAMEVAGEAADEIERLRANCSQWNDIYDRSCKRVRELEDELEHLRAQPAVRFTRGY